MEIRINDSEYKAPKVKEIMVVFSNSILSASDPTGEGEDFIDD